MIQLVHVLYWFLEMNRHMIIFGGFHWNLYSAQFSFALACISSSSQISISKLMLAVFRYHTYVTFTRGCCEGAEYLATMNFEELWHKFENEWNRYVEMEDAERQAENWNNFNEMWAAVRNRN